MPVPVIKKDLAYFYTRSAIDPLTRCWRWSLAKFHDGYGMYGDRHAKHRAHRGAFEAAFGAIPKGKHVMHKCDERDCVNPAHLALGTRAENMQDMMMKGRGRHQWKPRKFNSIGKDITDAS